MPSYILPYLLIGTTLGGTLSYITNKPEFLVISIPASIGMGMLKDVNIQNSDAEQTYASAGLKGIALYALGPFFCIGIAGVVISIILRD